MALPPAPLGQMIQDGDERSNILCCPHKKATTSSNTNDFWGPKTIGGLEQINDAFRCGQEGPQPTNQVNPSQQGPFPIADVRPITSPANQCLFPVAALSLSVLRMHGIGIPTQKGPTE